MIEAENLTKIFNGIKAIDGVSFRAAKGEVLGLLGPNGAGKTTTMRILTGYMPPTSGTARVAGYDVLEHSLEARRRTGYLPENPPLYNEMTVQSYLEFVARLKGVPRQRRREEVAAAMRRCSIEDVKNRIVGRLSKGYKQRVGLAQALLNSPEVLVLDEPTIGLDPKQIIEVRELIKELGGEHTVILSTHILPEVSMTCQRVVIIDRGRIVAVDTPENLTAKLKGAERIFLEVEAPERELCDKLKSIAGVIKVEVERRSNGRLNLMVESQLERDVRRELAAAVVQNGWGLLEMRSVTMSLEDIFLKLTTEEN